MFEWVFSKPAYSRAFEDNLFFTIDTHRELVHQMRLINRDIADQITREHDLELVDIRRKHDPQLVDIRREHYLELVAIRCEHDLQLVDIRQQECGFQLLLLGVFIMTTVLLVGKILRIQCEHDFKLIDIRHEHHLQLDLQLVDNRKSIAWGALVIITLALMRKIRASM